MVVEGKNGMMPVIKRELIFWQDPGGIGAGPVQKSPVSSCKNLRLLFIYKQLF